MNINSVFSDPLVDKRLKSVEVVKTSKVLVTPEIAMDWLTRNKTNRNLKPGIVSNYASQMVSGQWKDGTGESIKFDDKGRLIDGQHRLNAIVKCKKSIWLEVKTNMDWNTRKVIDTGARRIAADLLAIEGYTWPVHLAAVARFIIMFKMGKYSWAANNKGGQSDRGIYASNQDILKFVKEQDEELLEIIRDFSGIFYTKFKYISISMMSGLYILFSEKSQKDAEEFFEKLSTGVGLGQTNPIFHLREKLIREHSSRRKMLLTEKLALCIIAWNLFREGKKVNFLAFSENEKFPKLI